MSFRFPLLWKKSGDTARAFTQGSLSKFKHLIKWKKSESILEAGFASGSNSLQTLVPLLPHDYKEFIGSDISDEMIEYAKKEFKLPRSEVVKLDVCGEIPSEFHERFDHIFGFHLIHVMKDPRKAFKNIKDMLKPGGSTFLTFFQHTPIEHAFEKLKKSPKWGRYDHDVMMPPYHYSTNPLDEYQKDLEAAEFSKTVIQKAYETYTAKTDEDHKVLIDALHAVNPVQLQISDEKERNEYMKDYISKVFNGPVVNSRLDENGNKITDITTLNMIVYATK